MSGTSGNVVDPRIGGSFSGDSLALRPVPAAAPPRSSNPLAMLLRQQMQPQRPAGLLGKSFADPRTQAVLAAAGSLLGASGYSRMPTTFGQSIGPALSAYNTTMSQQAALQAAKRQQKFKNWQQIRTLTTPTSDIKVVEGKVINVITQPQLLPSGEPNPNAGQISSKVLADESSYFSKGSSKRVISELAPLIAAGTANADENNAYRLAYADLTRVNTQTVQTPSGTQTVQIPGMNLSQFPPPPGAPPEAASSQIIPTPISERISTEANKAFERMDKLLGVFDKYKSLLEKHGASPVPLTIANKELGASYTALLLELKELANLGVLSGQDEKLIKQWAADPTTIMAAAGEAIHGKEYLMADVNILEQMIQRAKTSLESRMGKMPGSQSARTIFPPGIPQGSIFIGKKQIGTEMFDIWRGPDGKDYIPDSQSSRLPTKAL